MSFTKTNINNSVKNQLNVPKSRSSEIVESLLEIIKSTLESGEDVLFNGFGKFCVREKSERQVRNPTTGEDMMLESRRVVAFKCAGGSCVRR